MIKEVLDQHTEAALLAGLRSYAVDAADAPGHPDPVSQKTGLSKDTTKGTRTIRLPRKEVMLKNKSYYKTSYGDEPGQAPKKGIITSEVKVYLTLLSMDVKFEGKNVVRHMDLTPHNHGSFPGNMRPWTYSDKQTLPVVKDKKDVTAEKEAVLGKRLKEKCADSGRVRKPESAH